MKQQFKVTGMSCAACSAAVEKAVRRVEGVKEAAVNLLEGRMVCELESPDVIEKVIAAVSRAGFEAEVILPEKKKDEEEETAETENAAAEDAEEEAFNQYQTIFDICKKYLQ